jgi:hypothetical protein
MHSRCLVFFSFQVGWGGGGKDFFHFSLVPMCSHYVPQVPNVFCNMFSITPHFYPICFGKCCPHFTCIGGSKGTNHANKNRTINWIFSIISFFLSYGPIKLARCKKKVKLKLEGTSPK